MSLYVAPSCATAPRLRVLVNQTVIDGLESWKITTTNNRQADQFNAQFSFIPGSDFSAAWWSNQSRVRLTLQAGFVDVSGIVTNWSTFLVGECDAVDMVMGTGIVRVAGRDLTALLIDQKITQTYQNQTASQVATALATAAGLTPNVAKTTALIGRYYRADHTNTALDQFSEASTQWDLLVYLAGQEGFDVWVEGTTLNFQPPASQPKIVNLHYSQGMIPQFAGIGLSLHRAMTLAKDVEVQVRSWDAQHKRAFTVKVRGSIQTNAGAVVKLGPPQTYVFVKPNMTHAQAQLFAQQKLFEISKHERVVEITMPGDLTTTVKDMIRLSGTDTSFDQDYYIDTIVRSISLKSGFTQALTIKNHSPQSESLP